jgi:hypothetical protein
MLTLVICLLDEYTEKEAGNLTVNGSGRYPPERLSIASRLNNIFMK